MKCKACGKVFQDDELYFCTGCGAMLKNPATDEIIEENREDSDVPETPEIAKAPVIDIEPSDIKAADEEKADDAEKTDEEPVYFGGIILDDDEPLPEPEKKDEPIIPEPEKRPEFSRPVEKPDVKPDEPKPSPARDTVSQPTPPPPPKPDIPLDAQPMIRETPKKPVKVGAGRLTGAAMISFFAIIVLILVNVLCSLKLGLSPDRIKNTVAKMDKLSFINAKYDGLSLSDNLYYETDFDKATHGFADKTEFNLFLSKTDLMEFLDDKAKSYAEYILEGKGDEPTIGDSEFVEFFMSYSDLSKDVFGYELQTADYNAIRSSLAEHGTADKLSVSKIGWEIKFHLENVKYILSSLTIGIFGALFAVLLIWIALTVNRKGKHLLGFYGNIFIWGGVATILAGLMGSAGLALAYVLTGDIICYVSSLLLLPASMYAVCIGAIVLVAGVIFKKIKKSLRIKEKRNAAIQKALRNANQMA